jgi:hypothetical protein
MAFWKGGNTIAVHFGVPGSYALYDIDTGSVLERSPEKSVSSQLPEWAKSQSEVSDEAVPNGPAYVEQRTQWIASVLRQIQTIHPGMKRRDLDRIVTTGGGLSTRFQRTFVLHDYRYIKVIFSLNPPQAPQIHSTTTPKTLLSQSPNLTWSSVSGIDGPVRRERHMDVKRLVAQVGQRKWHVTQGFIQRWRRPYSA